MCRPAWSCNSNECCDRPARCQRDGGSRSADHRGGILGACADADSRLISSVQGHFRLGDTNRPAGADGLPDVRINDKGLKIAPLEDDATPEAKLLKSQTYGLLPRVKITGLLPEADRWADFTCQNPRFFTGQKKVPQVSAAEFGGLSAMPNYGRARSLVESARRFLPNLCSAGAIDWAGHRPATPDSLPVIGESSHHARVFYAFGHGHLGLTQAATTGRLIVERLLGQKPSVDLSPFRIGRIRNREN